MSCMQEVGRKFKWRTLTFSVMLLLGGQRALHWWLSPTTPPVSMTQQYGVSQSQRSHGSSRLYIYIDFSYVRILHVCVSVPTQLYFQHWLLSIASRSDGTWVYMFVTVCSYSVQVCVPACTQGCSGSPLKYRRIDMLCKVELMRFLFTCVR